MDRTKTGALIAAARKEQNMTQTELAAALHVSDRAVSKWERGAGFPDISLLEPLADALGLGVLDLLRGERGTVPEPEPTIRQALAFLARQAKERTRRKWSQVLGGTCALLMAGFVLFAILDRAGVFLQEISLEVPATVYSAEGVSAGETTVAIDGSVKILGDRSFEGQFAIHEVETTCREGVMRTSGGMPCGQTPRTSCSTGRGITFLSVSSGCCISRKAWNLLAFGWRMGPSLPRMRPMCRC